MHRPSVSPAVGLIDELQRHSETRRVLSARAMCPKKRDWLAERIGFEFVGAFRWTIALYSRTKRIFRLSAETRESFLAPRCACVAEARDEATNQPRRMIRGSRNPSGAGHVSVAPLRSVLSLTSARCPKGPLEDIGTVVPQVLWRLQLTPLSEFSIFLLLLIFAGRVRRAMFAGSSSRTIRHHRCVGSLSKYRMLSPPLRRVTIAGAEQARSS